MATFTVTTRTLPVMPTFAAVAAGVEKQPAAVINGEDADVAKEGSYLLATLPAGPMLGLTAPGEERPPAAATDMKDADVAPEWSYVIATLVLFGAGLAIGWLIRHPAFTPPSGISVFAGLYIVAQVIERLQDPFTPWIGLTQDRTLDKGKASANIENSRRSDRPTIITQRKAKARRDKAVVEARNKPTSPNLEAAAKAQRQVDQIRANLTLVMWGSSSALAMLASGVFGFYMLKGVGVSDPPVLLDIAVTGLAIGAGTKPLHDLISNITQGKTGKQDPVETT